MVEHHLSAFKEVVRHPRMAWGNAHPRVHRLVVAGLALFGVLLTLVQLDTHLLAQTAAAVGHAGRIVLGAAWLLVLLLAAVLALRLAMAEQIVSRRAMRRTLAGMSLLGLLVLVVVVLPPRFTDHHRFNSAAEELKAQNDVRTSLLQTLGGLLLATGVYLTWRQLQETREGRVTDRYTRTIEQLGRTDALAVRLGGLYALERIARESSADQESIAEVLCAYARIPPVSPSSVAEARGVQCIQPKLDARSEQAEGNKPAPLSLRAPDVQAAMIIIGRWKPRLGTFGRSLDLHGADLRGGDFVYYELEGADFRGAQLQHADLRLATLRYAYFYLATLEYADLRGAHLEYADLQGANLRHAKLHGATLRSAKLRGAKLEGATFDHRTEWPEGWDPTVL